MTTPDSVTSIIAERHPPLEQWIAGFRRQVRTRLLLEGFAYFVVAILGAALLTFLLDRAFRLSPTVRFGLVAACVIALCVLIWRQIIAPLRARLDTLTLAAALDRQTQGNGAITAALATAMQLPNVSSNAIVSSAMVRQAVLHSQDMLDRIDYRNHLDDRRRDHYLLTLVGTLLLSAAIGLAVPSTVRLWAARTFLGSTTPWPQMTYMQVEGAADGTIVVPRGEPFVLRVNAKPGSVVPDHVTIRVKEGTAGRVESNLAAFAANDFRYDSAGIRDVTTVELRGGDDFLGPITIRPADRPVISELRLVSQHPTEAEPKAHAFTGDEPDLSFLPRTHLRLLFAANTAIQSARVISSTTRPAAADLHQDDDRHFSVEWEHDADTRLQIDMVSRDAHLASTVTDVAIGLKVDHPPRVTLAFTGVRQRVTPTARIPLTLEARDDYGVASAGLSVKTETPDPANPAKLNAATKQVPLFGPAHPATELDVQQTHTLELAPLTLPPGSLITLNATATDACYIGTQTSQSRLLAFRVVSPEELFREILLRQQAERSRFRKQTDEARAARAQLIGPISSSQVADIARRHRAIQREVAAVRTVLSDTVTEMRLNGLGTDQTYELIQTKVITPLSVLNDELMNPQKDALETLVPTDPKAVSAAADRQDAITARMQEILKQMSQWDSFVDVLNQLNEIIRLQGQVQQQTVKLKKDQTEGVFEK